MLRINEEQLLQTCGTPERHPIGDDLVQDILRWNCGCLGFTLLSHGCDWIPCSRHHPCEAGPLTSVGLRANDAHRNGSER